MAGIAEVGAKEGKKPEKEQGEVTIYFGIFFDGTNNNRLQVLVGKNYRSRKTLEKFNQWVKEHGCSPQNVYEARKIAKEAKTIEGKAVFSDKEIEDLFPEANANDFSTDEALIEEYQKRIDNIDVAAGDANVYLKKELEKKLDNIKAFNEVKDRDFFGKDDKTGKLKWNETAPSELGQWKGDVEWNSQIKDYDQSAMFGLGSQPEMQTNDYTNIALLEPLYNAKQQLDANEYAYRIYVTGCGTDRDITEGDSLIGKATGKWSKTDVIQKVTDAVNAIKSKLIHFSKASEVSIKYHIFGFSRGAAEARILANILSKDTTTEELVKQITKCVTKKGVNIQLIQNQKSVQIPFVGLFDTVPSIGINKIVKDFESNIREYGLNVLAETNDVVNIFHICALDEYRSNFALTPITPKSGKLLEIYLPGTHSDIGGGYSVGKSKSGFLKSKKLPSFPLKSGSVVYEISEEALKDLGWYKTGDKLQKTLNAIVIERYVKKGYSYIPLHLMLDYACKKVEGIFQHTKKYAVPSEIEEYNYTVKTWYEGGGGIWPTDDNQYRYLRQHYLHFSSQEGGVDGMVCEPNIENNTYVRKRYE